MLSPITLFPPSAEINYVLSGGDKIPGQLTAVVEDGVARRIERLN